MRIVGGQIQIVRQSPSAGNGGIGGNTHSRGYRSYERAVLAGCDKSGGKPCLECPLPFCQKYERAFGVAID